MGPPELADLNGDGYLDIIVPCARADARDAGQLLIFLGDGTGRFRESAVQTGTRSGGLRLALGDVDGDGNADAVLTRHDEYKIRVFLGDGTGRLAPAPEFTTGIHDGATPHTHDVVLADVNADGSLDVIASNADDNAVALLLGDGTGHFRPARGSPFAAGIHPYEGLSVGDVTGDGAADIVVPNLHGDTVTILSVTDGGVFEPIPGSPFPVGVRPGYATHGRIDNGQLLDVVVTHDDDPIATVLLNPGKSNGDRSQTVTLNLPEPAWGAVLADLDCDGDDDLVLGGQQRRIMIFFNDAGRFRATPATLRSKHLHPGYITVADMNADGKPDLIIGHFASSRSRGDRVELLLQR